MKRRGYGTIDHFYHKVQSEVISHALDYPLSSVCVTDFDENNYFITIDRVVFYVIHKDRFFLTDKFYSDCNSLFHSENFSSVYYKDLTEIYSTGKIYDLAAFSAGTGKILELQSSSGFVYLLMDRLSLFPKSVRFFQSSNGPVFLYSSLNFLLGGIFPLSLPKDVLI